jgi:hypothetical protein
VPVRLSRPLLWGLAAAAAAIGLALAPLVATADFISDRGLWTVLDLVIGFGFAGVGLFAWYRRPDNRVGALMVATAFAWYAVVASNTAPSLLWTLGTLLSNLFAATAIHLCSPSRPGAWRRRWTGSSSGPRTSRRRSAGFPPCCSWTPRRSDAGAAPRTC